MADTMRAAKGIEQLMEYGIQKGMMTSWDIPQVRNQLMEILTIQEPYTGEKEPIRLDKGPMAVLTPLLDYAVEMGLINDTTTERDLLDAKLMGQMLPRQSELRDKFYAIMLKEGIQKATSYFYELSQAANYIRMDRIAKNIQWSTHTEYGDIEITINLSKPEKDPKEIAAEKNAVKVNYPKCLLCVENVGYAGRLNHPGRTNHRIVPITLTEEQWYLQYSPYVYYNEHAIVLSETHRPMTISGKTFKGLLEFVDKFPHYFIGSNADLPIVGGSILSHDHFQAGRYVFPMEKATHLQTFELPSYPGVRASMLKWPLSVIRIAGQDQEKLIQLATEILEKWRCYSDESMGILAYSGEVPHNTITPIARVNGEGMFELDLALRNNRTDDVHPDGIFHPHRELQHIKKENIGLIEVMGLAILPDRLKTELGQIEKILTGAVEVTEVLSQETMVKHGEWIQQLVAAHGTNNTAVRARTILEDGVGKKFTKVLECSGVFKQDEEGIAAFTHFINTLF